jgi:hypothetical protein
MARSTWKRGIHAKIRSAFAVGASTMRIPGAAVSGDEYPGRHDESFRPRCWALRSSLERRARARPLRSAENHEASSRSLRGWQGAEFFDHPNRWFPVEFHSVLPLVHGLPRP